MGAGFSFAQLAARQTTWQICANSKPALRPIEKMKLVERRALVIARQSNNSGAAEASDLNAKVGTTNDEFRVPTFGVSLSARQR